MHFLLCLEYFWHVFFIISTFIMYFFSFSILHEKVISSLFFQLTFEADLLSRACKKDSRDYCLYKWAYMDEIFHGNNGSIASIDYNVSVYIMARSNLLCRQIKKMSSLYNL